MKKTTLLNHPLSSVIASMGHTDTLTIGDCGLPIPEGPEAIDLAVVRGTPSFMDVFKATTAELFIEGAVIAEEMEEHNKDLYKELKNALDDLSKAQGNKIEIKEIPHKEFKKQTAASRAVVRTGEATPYANIILVSGVTFTAMP